MATGVPRQGFLLWALILLLFVFLAYLAYEPLIRMLFPLPFKTEVGAAARNHHLDPFLVTAVIKVESSFDPAAVSPKGARGLMQIMPNTATWVAQRTAMEDFDLSQLRDPAINVEIGTWYLAYLRSEFQGNIVLALAAYNGGPSNVQRWLDEVRWSGERETVDDIPFSETRRYVNRVLQTYDGYRRVYGGDWEAARHLLPWQGSVRGIWRVSTWFN